MICKRQVVYLGAASCLVFSSIVVHGQLVVAGKISWTDRRGSDDALGSHAAREVIVEACDTTLSPTRQVIATTRTDDLGHYTVTVPFTVGTQRKIVIRARSESPAASVQAIGTFLTYILSSPVQTIDKADAPSQIDVRGDFTTTTNAAFSVLDALLGARQFVSKFAKIDLPKISVEFPTSGSTSYYLDNKLHILQADRWDWDVMMHEYGHYVSKSFNLDNNPGGTHYFDENIGDRIPKDNAVRLAWGEGWPTYFAITAQREMAMVSLNVPNVGDSTYSDTEDASIEIPLDSNGDGSLGEDNEVSVMRILYDIGGQKTGISLTPSDVWSILQSTKPVNLSDAMKGIQQTEDTRQTLLLGVVEVKHHVAASLSPIPSAAALPETPILFSWSENGGGKNHPNNKFTLRFYNSSMDLILETGAIAGNTYQPTQGEWKILKDMNANSVAVVGFNVDTPNTGPYFSFAQSLFGAPAVATMAVQPH